MATFDYDELVAYLQNFQIYGSLAHVAVLSHHLMECNIQDLARKRISPMPTEWALAAFAKILLMHANDVAPRTLGRAEMKVAFRMYNNLWDPLLDINQPEPADVNRYLFRMAYEQFDFQEETSRAIPRTLLLMKALNKKVESKAGFDTETQFLDLVGLSIEDYMAIGLAIFCFPGGRFNKSILINSEIISTKKYITMDAVNKFLGHACVDYQTFRKLTNLQRAPEKVYKEHAFNVLKKYPIIKVSQSCKRQISVDYIAPCAKYLFDKITAGLCYDLQDKFSKESGNEFLDYFGTLFEDYVGLLLDYYLPKDKFKRGFDFDRRMRKSIDWFVRDENTLVLLECKKSAATYESRRLGDVDRIGEEIKGKIAKAANQIAQNIKYITDKHTEFEEFHRYQKFQGLIVVYEPLYWANSLIRDMVGDIPIDGENFNYHIINIRDFELLVACLRENELSYILDRKGANNSSLREDFKDYFPRSGLEVEDNEMLVGLYNEFYYDKFGIRD